MSISNKTKLILFTLILAVFVLGLAVSGPKFFNKLQMQFGFKGKIDLIEQCLQTKGCAITTDELDLYHNYHTLQKSKIGKRLKETEFGISLKEEEKSK